MDNQNKMKSLWVWNIQKKEWPKLVKLCQDYSISEVYVCKLTVDLVDYLNHYNIKAQLLIGQQSPLDRKAIPKSPITDVHLDLEYSGKDDWKIFIEDFNICLFAGALSKREHQIKLVVDVECWPKDFKYWKYINRYADEVCLMNYHTSWFRQLKRAILPLLFLRKPFYVGVETNPELNHSYKTKEALDKNVKILEKIFSWHPKFKGIAYHHYYTLKEVK